MLIFLGAPPFPLREHGAEAPVPLVSAGSCSLPTDRQRFYTDTLNRVLICISSVAEEVERTVC